MALTMKRKFVRMVVTLSVPADMTPQEARREARTLINLQCNYNADHGDVRAQKIEPFPRNQPAG